MKKAAKKPATRITKKPAPGKVPAMKRANIQSSESWTVLAEIRGEGIGLSRGTKIRVTGSDRQVTLTPLGLHDWDRDPVLRRLAKPEKTGDGLWDPEWRWQGRVNRDGEPHVVKLGVMNGDPGILALFVNQNGMAVLLR